MSMSAVGNQLVSAAQKAVIPIVKESAKQGTEAVRDESLGYFKKSLSSGPAKNHKIKEAKSAPAKVKHAAFSLAKWAVPIVASAALAVGTQAAITAVIA